MPYIKRNEQGGIAELLDAPLGENSEWLEVSSPKVVDFLKKTTKADNIKDSLASSDSDMARVVEDLIDMLMEKQVFVFTELPEAVQNKLNARRRLRHEVNAISNLIGEEGDIL